jgi:hypothetical protein
MNGYDSSKPSSTAPVSLETLRQLITQLAEQSKTDELHILSLLRLLERSHQTIREQYFQPLLPCDRHRLYKLLREIESEGGWPYIPRIRLKELLDEVEKNGSVEEP